MIDFEEIIVLRDEKNKQKARYAKHRKDAQKKARHRVSIYQKCSNFSDDSLQKGTSPPHRRARIACEGIGKKGCHIRMYGKPRMRIPGSFRPNLRRNDHD